MVIYFLPAILYAGFLYWAVKKLDKLAERPKLIELMRFPGNERAASNYRLRAELGGHNVRAVRERVDPVALDNWANDGGRV